MNKESSIIIEKYDVKNISIEYENLFKDLKEMR